MKRFIVKSLAEWQMYDVPLHIPVEKTQKGRVISLEINAPGWVRVYAEEADMSGDTGPILIGAGSGMFEIVVSSRASHGMTIMIDGDADHIAVKNNTRDFVVEAKSFEKFTEISYKKARNPEVERMMGMMKLNEIRRNEQLAEDRAKLAEMLEQVKNAATATKVSENSGNTGGGGNGENTKPANAGGDGKSDGKKAETGGKSGGSADAVGDEKTA